MKYNSCLPLINNNLRFQYDEYEDKVLIATEQWTIRFQDEDNNEIYFLSSIFIDNK